MSCGQRWMCKAGKKWPRALRWAGSKVIPRQAREGRRRLLTTPQTCPGSPPNAPRQPSAGRRDAAERAECRAPAGWSKTGDAAAWDKLLRAGSFACSRNSVSSPASGTATASPRGGGGRRLMRNPSVPRPEEPLPQIHLPFQKLKGPSLPPLLYWNLIIIFLPARAERG